MLPVVALVGRPNVGKSTLFNVLTRSRDALVSDYPGLTRDRQYGQVQTGARRFLLVDTGGMVEDPAGLESLAMRQVERALSDADIVLFLVDAREGLHPDDRSIADRLRRLGKTVRLVVNKTEGMSPDTAVSEFHALGLPAPIPLAAAHGTGITRLLEEIAAALPEAEEPSVATAEDSTIRIAVVGRPNVGKSTLVNRVLGEERVVVFDAPGTTRDSIYVPFERRGRAYTLIDTAGIRRRSRVDDTIEKFSAIKAFQAIERAHVVIYLIDASEGVTDQDATLLGMILEFGRGLILGFNKWDGLSPEQRELVKRQVSLKLPFLDFAARFFISALHGTGVGHLIDAVETVYRSATAELGTSQLTAILQECQSAHQPPLVRGRRIRLKFAHQGGQTPPVIVIHGNQTDEIPASYKRYLMNSFRRALGLMGTPIRLEFRTGPNPFKAKRNLLTERQVRKRRRLLRHAKK